ncbi:hypothetical protein HOG98_02670 [bacterium]|jgi:hypothetical protein|nr:hypothetical protein [bacterium]
MSIQNLGQPLANNNIGPLNNAGEVGSVLLNFNQKKVKVEKGGVKEMARGLAKIMKDLGETNDEEKFAEDITEDLMEAFKKVKERQEKKNK